MRVVKVAIEARFDVAMVLLASYEKFGVATADRYRALIEQAYIDLAQDPERAGVVTLDGLPDDLSLYPIRHSRNRVAAEGRVNRARHVLAFRKGPDSVEIVRVLHDAMDLHGRLGRS